ncbi:polar amino acid transport system substrate-binding protein [Oxalobacteraceae bacterium GrIS 1.11]
MARASLLLAVILTFLAPGAGARPSALLFCHENQDSYPWVLKDRPGLNIMLIMQLESALGMPIRLRPLPWKRCLAELAANQVDGAFASSFKADRMAMGRYPLDKDGMPDASKKLHQSDYSLYRAKGDDLDWDGQRFRNLRGPIGTLSGFSIADFLKQRGAGVDDGSKSPEDTLRKVAIGRLQGAALQTPRAERLLQQHPELGRSIERLPVLLEARPYYLMLSFKLVKEEPRFAEHIWSLVAQIRASAAYQRQEREFYGTN